MALPPIEIDVRADTAQAEAGFDRVEQSIIGASNATKRLDAGLAVSGGRVKALGTQMRGSAMHTANLTAQFNDIGVMLASGQSPLMLAMQQGTQINQVFAQMGGTGRQALSGIGAGLKQMISPMSILTIGTIAGGAALVQWAMSASDAGEEGSSFNDTLKEINESLAEGEQRIEAYNRGFENAKSVEVDDEIRRITDAIIALDVAMAEIEGGSTGLSRSLGIGQERLALMREQQAVLRQTLQDLETEADRIEAAKQRFEEKKIQAEATSVAIGNAVGGLQNMITLTGNLADRSADVKDNFLEIVKAMGIANLAAEQSQLGRGGAGPGGPMGAAALFEARSGGIFVPRPPVPPAGGGGFGPVDTTAADLEALETKLMTETETIQSTYADRHELLLSARERELLTEEEYNQRLLDIERDKNDKLTAMDAFRYGTALDRTQKFFGDTANAFSGGNEKLIAIGQKFAKVEALINAGRAFAQVAADPSLPWYAKIPAAVGVAAAISSFSNSAGIGSGSSAAGAGSGGGAGGGGAAQQQEVTTFSFTLQNDPMGFGESFARQMIEQLNSAQRDGGRIQAVLT